MRRYWIAVVLALVSLSFPALAAQEKAAPKGSSAASSAPLNINTATVAQLEALPGIGARTAEAIVEHRSKVGSFKKIEELMNVKGIGEKSFLKLKPLITVGSGGQDGKR
jgi:competence protein ComEA